MATLTEVHRSLGATFEERAGRPVVRDYGSPDRAGRAVRDGVGVTEQPVDVVEVTGADAVEYVDNVVSNRVPAEPGWGCYALLCDPKGRIETDLYAVTTEGSVRLFLPPGRGERTVAGWEVFIQDVAFDVPAERDVVLGLHGPASAAALAAALEAADPPTDPLAAVEGRLAGASATVVRADAPLGEVGFWVNAAAEDAGAVLAALVDGDPAAVPFGGQVFDALALEAGTPRFEADLAGHLPNDAGVRNGLDFAKGCYVGQEVVSRIENRGRPSHHLVGLRPGACPAAGAAVLDDGEVVGAVTRAAEGPTVGGPVALAYVPPDVGDELEVEFDDGAVPARRVPLPFVEGSERSARLPRYPE